MMKSLKNARFAMRLFGGVKLKVGHDFVFVILLLQNSFGI